MDKRKVLYYVEVDAKTGEAQLKRFTGEFDKGLSENEKRLRRVKQAIAALGVYKIAKELYELNLMAAKDFAAFEKGIIEVSTLSDEVTAKLAKYKGQILELSKETGQPVELLNKALYDSISAGIPAGQAIAFVGTSAKLAIGGVSDASATVDLMTGMLNAYGKEALEAQTLSDKFFATVKAGKTTISEMAAYLGGVAPSAEAAGLSIDEMLAAHARLTVVLGNNSEAVTALNGLLKAIAAPSEELADIFAREGYESGLAAIKAEGFVGVLQMLERATGGSLDKMVALIPEVRGAKGAMVLAAEGAEGFAANLDDIADSSGASEEAAAKMAATLDLKINRATAALTAMRIELGDKLSPDFHRFIDAVIENGIPALGRLAALVSGPLVETFSFWAEKTAQAADFWTSFLPDDSVAAKYTRLTKEIAEVQEALKRSRNRDANAGREPHEFTKKMEARLRILQSRQAAMVKVHGTQEKQKQDDLKKTGATFEEQEKKKQGAQKKTALETEKDRKKREKVEERERKKREQAEKKEADAKNKLLAQFEKDHKKATMSALDYEVDALEEQYEAYEKVVADKAKLNEWYWASAAKASDEGVYQWNRDLEVMLNITEEKFDQMDERQKATALLVANTWKDAQSQAMVGAAQLFADWLEGDQKWEDTARALGGAVGGMIGTAIGTYYGGPAGGQAGGIAGTAFGEWLSKYLVADPRSTGQKMFDRIAQLQQEMDAGKLNDAADSLAYISAKMQEIGDQASGIDELDAQWKELIGEVEAAREAIKANGADSEEAREALEGLSRSAADYAINAALSGEASMEAARAAVELAIATNETAARTWEEIEVLKYLFEELGKVDERTRGLAQNTANLSLAQSMLNSGLLLSEEAFRRVVYLQQQLAAIEERRREILEKLKKEQDPAEIERLRQELAKLNEDAKKYGDELHGLAKGMEGMGDGADKAGTEMDKTGKAADRNKTKVNAYGSSIERADKKAGDAAESFKKLAQSITDIPSEKTITVSVRHGESSGSAAYGEDDIPYDNALYRLHKSETVLSALSGDAPLYRSLKRSGAWGALKAGVMPTAQAPAMAAGGDGVSIGQIVINQLPGESGQDLAERVIDEIRERSQAGEVMLPNRRGRA